MAFITYVDSIVRDDDDDEDECDGGVQTLQQQLFPVIPSPSNISSPGGFFMNLVLKPTPTAIDDDDAEQYLSRKDSKELFAVIKDPSTTIQAPRWPTECQNRYLEHSNPDLISCHRIDCLVRRIYISGKSLSFLRIEHRGIVALAFHLRFKPEEVLDEKIKHISYTPPVPEPYYIPTGKEVQPKPVGEELGIIIYQYYPISAVNYFSRSSIGGSRYLLPTCPTPEENSLRFESRFESGNLAKAIKITAIYYELYVRTDLYTNKHMQWFYFRVTNMKKNMTYRFSIVNMTKEDSLYNEGMKPLLYSTKDAHLHNIGWRRCGNNITYYCNDNPETEDPDQTATYTLTFTLDFPHEGDMVYLAYSYPYTYTDLQDYLLELSKHPIKSTYTTLRLLCRTLAGNNLYYVTVTAKQEDEEKKKKAVIITARVHPGETPASWMMKGVLDFLTGDSGPAKELREKFIFKLVPMLNPDGVIVGNNRCSLAGTDLNRQYRTVIRETYPAVWYTKIMIRRMVEECGVAMYCDLHAHSRKHNIFLYGCENRRVVEKKLCEQVFPLMLHKNTADKFSFEDCKFRIQRCKEGTGRVAMWMMGIANSYTMEASFAGSMKGGKTETHFSTQDYEQMGRSFCQTLLDFYDDDPRKERLRIKIIERLVREGSNADEPTNIPLSDYSSDDGDTSSFSDEVGREDYTRPLIVPPSSPALMKLSKKPHKFKNKTTTIYKSQNLMIEQRKTFQVSKTNLDLKMPSRVKYTSYSSSDSDSDNSRTKKVVRKKRSKKRNKKRQSFAKFSDTEELKTPPRSLSVMDIIPSSNMRSQSWHRSLVPPKPLTEGRPSVKSVRTTTEQLAEVQAKLTTLKNRLWYGSGQGDANVPISWGQSKLSENKNRKKPSFKKQTPNPKQEKLESNKNEKKTKIKEDTKVKEKSAKKKQNALRKPITVQWLPAEDFNKINNRTYKAEKKNVAKNAENEDDSKGKSKKKKKKNNMQKKATLVSNVNVFTKKD